jgi:hypothetical protein
MKIKILLFVNLVLIGTAIGLFINRSTGPDAASAVTGAPAPAPIPPETPAPQDETDSNVSPQPVDGCKSNAVPKAVPQTNAGRNSKGQNWFFTIEKDFA